LRLFRTKLVYLAAFASDGASFGVLCKIHFLTRAISLKLCRALLRRHVHHVRILRRQL
jgi:hypothetical protein